MAVKVALIGAPSSRKSTTADHLNVLLKTKKFNSQVCGEYVVDYMLKHADNGRVENIFEQYVIFEGQVLKESEMAAKREYVICDSSGFAGYIYARLLVKDEKPLNKRTIKVLKDLHEKMIQHAQTYDYIFLFPPEDSQLIQDGVRFQTSEEERYELYNKLKGFMDVECIPYTIIKGSVEEKAEKIFKIITKKKDKSFETDNDPYILSNDDIDDIYEVD